MEEDSVQARFMEVAGCSSEQAEFFLEAAGGDLGAALAIFGAREGMWQHGTTGLGSSSPC